MTLCVCSSGKKTAQCCELYISGKQLPSNPQSLMRSRYTAYMAGNMDYIATTMYGAALNTFNSKDEQEWAKKIKWLRLHVLHAPPVIEGETKGYVEFKVYYLLHEYEHILHEVCEFEYIAGRWYLVGATEIKSEN